MALIEPEQISLRNARMLFSDNRFREAIQELHAPPSDMVPPSYLAERQAVQYGLLTRFRNSPCSHLRLVTKSTLLTSLLVRAVCWEFATGYVTEESVLFPQGNDLIEYDTCFRILSIMTNQGWQDVFEATGRFPNSKRDSHFTSYFLLGGERVRLNHVDVFRQDRLLYEPL